jgi:His-Xaa-Ser system protein HxsD
VSDTPPDADSPPTDELRFLLDERRVVFTVDETLYPLDAIYGAAYRFVDRCWLHLRRPADRQVEVRLKAKEPTTEAALEALAGEFGNELLNQVVRQRVGEANGKLREYVLARAFTTAPARSSIDALLAELDAEELAEDELSVPVPWATGERDDA